MMVWCMKVVLTFRTRVNILLLWVYKAEVAHRTHTFILQGSAQLSIPEMTQPPGGRGSVELKVPREQIEPLGLLQLNNLFSRYYLDVALK